MPKLSVKGAVTRGVDGIGCVDACTRSGGTRWIRQSYDRRRS